MDVSLRLFLEKGYEQTTVLDIVANLGGLTRGAFYHHFKSKEEVLLAILQKDFDENNPFHRARQAKAANGLERLKLALRFGLKANAESEQRKSVVHLALSLLTNPRFLAEHIKEISHDAAHMAAIIEEGMADGSIKQGNAKALAELFFLLVNVWVMPNIFPGDEKDLRDKLDIINHIFGKGGYGFVDEEMGESYFHTFADIKNK
jgi:AcrR family transcriptional regulator